MTSMRIIDSHAHLTDEQFRTDVEDVIARAKTRGLVGIVSLGTDAASSERALEIAQTHDMVVAAAGVHPHEAGKFVEADWKRLMDLWQQPRVCAVGEIGLDYYYDFADKATQWAVLVRQLEIAGEVKKPVALHVREAASDVLKAVREVGLPSGGVWHCFTGSDANCDIALSLGLSLSLSGVVTFPKSEALRQTVKRIPADRLLVETDSPYLAPVPFRGKRNEPAWVMHTAARVAEVREQDLAVLCEQTYANTRRLFGLQPFFAE